MNSFFALDDLSIPWCATIRSVDSRASSVASPPCTYKKQQLQHGSKNTHIHVHTHTHTYTHTQQTNDQSNCVRVFTSFSIYPANFESELCIVITAASLSNFLVNLEKAASRSSASSFEGEGGGAVSMGRKRCMHTLLVCVCLCHCTCVCVCGGGGLVSVTSST